MKKVAILLLLIASCMAFSVYKKYMVEDPDALCLDGTTPAYYIKYGDPTKWIISFEGGGWCGSAAGL